MYVPPTNAKLMSDKVEFCEDGTSPEEHLKQALWELNFVFPSQEEWCMVDIHCELMNWFKLSNPHRGNSSCILVWYG